ncbi:MAG: S8 family peptidase [Oscillatoria sp. SIO1A7]|nr:S8 family peptidase [Oscillatoria sp. SIO1A7]
MAEERQFPHIQLKLTKEGKAKPARGGPAKTNPITDANRNNRYGHGRKLETSRLAIIADWKDARKEREQEDQPPLPEVIPLILQTDPEAFDAEKLKSFGIEVIAELEDGYIIGASVDDPELSEFQEKIEKFINQERGGGKIPEIWGFIDGARRPKHILSPKLWKKWGSIKDEQIYTVDVGVACLGNKPQLPKAPKRNDGESDDSFFKRAKRWMDKRDITYQEWDECKSEREDDLIQFVNKYRGDILSAIIDGKISKYAELPDSFSCRIQISGKGLRDLVLNFPYIFEVAEPDEFAELVLGQGLADEDDPNFQLEKPASNAPKVCVIDSGIQEKHPLLKAAIDSEDSRSWITGEIDQKADLVSNGGHGTRVAGAVLYPRTVPRTGRQQAICWIQNARVLDARCDMPEEIVPPDILGEIVEFYHGQTGTQIFNHSIAAKEPCETKFMSPWASAIDQLTWQNDVLFIVAAGNLPSDARIDLTRFSVAEHLAANRPYPDYILEDSCQIANPAQSLMALTVGSISLQSYRVPPYYSFAEEADRPSAFSRYGLGIWETIKPEVVEYGGDFVTDGGNPPNVTWPKEVCPELVRSTRGGGPTLASDNVGTSFAAPKVSHIAACIAAELPNESCLLYRGLIVQSARWPAWAANSQNKKDVIRQIGYGIPSLDRTLKNTPNRITLITQGINKIKAREARIYQVQLPKIMQSPGGEVEILLEVTLSYKAQPRRTRRNCRKYLSTWLDWDCSKRGEDPDVFLARILKEYDAPENAEKGESMSWTLGKQNNYGQIREVSRGAGTIQKDWTYVKSHQLREAFCIGVVGHEGWNNDPDAEVPYSLVVSFEATQADLPIYASVVEAQQLVELQVETEIEI